MARRAKSTQFIFINGRTTRPDTEKDASMKRLLLTTFAASALLAGAALATSLTGIVTRRTIEDIRRAQISPRHGPGAARRHLSQSGRVQPHAVCRDLSG